MLAEESLKVQLLEKTTGKYQARFQDLGLVNISSSTGR